MPDCGPQPRSRWSSRSPSSAQVTPADRSEAEARRSIAHRALPVTAVSVWVTSSADVGHGAGDGRPCATARPRELMPDGGYARFTRDARHGAPEASFTTSG